MHNFIIENMKEADRAFCAVGFFILAVLFCLRKKEKITMEIQVLTFPKR